MHIQIGVEHMQTNPETNTQGIDTTPTAKSLDEFSTIEQLAANNPNLITENRLRWILRERHNNGLAPAVKKLGKNLLVHVPTFVTWLMQQEG